MVEITILLLEGYSNFVLSCLLEPLRMLHEQYQEDIRWQIITADDQPVSSSSGLCLTPNLKVEDLGNTDLLMIISSNGFREHVTPENQRLVMSLVRQSNIILSADAGSWLLASTGLLDDLTATLHWSCLAEFAETFPHVHISQERYIMEGRFWSCGGAATALDLMYAFIADRFGPDKAYAVTSMFTHDSSLPKGDLMQPSALADQSKARLSNVIKLMVDSMEHPRSLPDIAEETHMSPRTLHRLFKEKLGVTPGQYYQSLRLAQARELARTTSFGLREIALRCGYNDAAALSKAFRQVYGAPLRQMLRR